MADTSPATSTAVTGADLRTPILLLDSVIPPMLLDAAATVPMKLLDRVVAELLMFPPLMSIVNPVCVLRM